MTDKEAFRRKFLDQMDKLGKAKAQSLLLDAWGDDRKKDIILLCYEDVTSNDEAKNWCHRTILAEWFKTRLGIEIEEYPDSGCFGAKHKVEEKPQEEDEDCEQMKLF